MANKDIIFRICRTPGCGKQATYGYIYHDPWSCEEHRKLKRTRKAERLEKRVDCLCQSMGCTFSARPNKAGLQLCGKHIGKEHRDPGLYCYVTTCRLPVVHNSACEVHQTPEEYRICAYFGCSRYSKPGTQRCGRHISVSCCKVPGCCNEAAFGTTCQYLHCYDHKTESDVMLKRPICNYQDCKEKAKYGSWIDFIPSRCGQHKIAGFENLYRARCEVPRCLNKSTCAFPDRNPYRCEKHALPGMIERKKNRKTEISEPEPEPEPTSNPEPEPEQVLMPITFDPEIVLESEIAQVHDVERFFE